MREKDGGYEDSFETGSELDTAPNHHRQSQRQHRRGDGDYTESDNYSDVGGSSSPDGRGRYGIQIGKRSKPSRGEWDYQYDREAHRNGEFQDGVSVAVVGSFINVRLSFFPPILYLDIL